MILYSISVENKKVTIYCIDLDYDLKSKYQTVYKLYRMHIFKIIKNNSISYFKNVIDSKFFIFFSNYNYSQAIRRDLILNIQEVLLSKKKVYFYLVDNDNALLLQVTNNNINIHSSYFANRFFPSSQKFFHALGKIYEKGYIDLNIYIDIYNTINY